MTIEYIKGDATYPVGNDYRIVCHVVNDIGAWGAGFVMAIEKRWPNVSQKYKDLVNREKPILGTVQYVNATDNIIVANMFAQKGIRKFPMEVPLSYKALEECLIKVEAFSASIGASLHMPRIGCGLAGGSWVAIERILDTIFKERKIKVYDLYGDI